MTFTIKSEYIETDRNHYLIEIYQAKFENGFHVGAYIKYGKCEYYQTVNERYYGNIESAKRRYSYLKGKAKRNEL